jgi:hypothetical protein
MGNGRGIVGKDAQWDDAGRYSNLASSRILDSMNLEIQE